MKLDSRVVKKAGITKPPVKKRLEGKIVEDHVAKKQCNTSLQKRRTAHGSPGARSVEDGIGRRKSTVSVLNLTGDTRIKTEELQVEIRGDGNKRKPSGPPHSAEARGGGLKTTKAKGGWGLRRERNFRQILGGGSGRVGA